MNRNRDMDREQNLGVRIRDSIIHCNREFTITHIHVWESSEGMKLSIEAGDLIAVNKEETKKVEMDDVTQKMMEMLRKLFEGGYPGGL